MDHPIVSIGMPVFNAAKHLRAAIDSVLNQSYSNFELILTDDGSIDGSLEIIRSYLDKRIVLIQHTENKGIGYSLNEQIQLSRGTYFARMDADDLMFPDRIEKQLHFLETHPNIDLLGAQAIVIDQENQIMGLRKPKLVASINEILEGGCFIHPTVMGKTSWFQEHLYHPDFSGTEDHELFLRTYPLSSFYNQDFPVLFYRENNPIRLSTYLHRQGALIKGIGLNKSIIGSRFKIHWTVWKIQIKCQIIRVLAWLKMDSLILKQRNLVLTKNQEAEYERILNQQMN
ncbi:MAG: glycosyl transferase family 2 [Chitinophagaceae bacterium BSSC1]|nr:MAG: glycosyl transferase family 2 [Chitinophagaceae bacterium BSSC1]